MEKAAVALVLALLVLALIASVPTVHKPRMVCMWFNEPPQEACAIARQAPRTDCWQIGFTDDICRRSSDPW